MQPHPLRTPVSLQSPVKILMENSGCQMWQTLADTCKHQHTQTGFWLVGCQGSCLQILLDKPDITPKKHAATCYPLWTTNIASSFSNPLFPWKASCSSLLSLGPWGRCAAHIYFAVLCRKEACQFLFNLVRDGQSVGSGSRVMSKFKAFLDGSRQTSRRGKCLKYVVYVRCNVEVFKEAPQWLLRGSPTCV